MSNIINFPGFGEYEYTDEYQDAVNHVIAFSFKGEEISYDKLERTLLSVAEVITIHFGKEEAALMLRDAMIFSESLNTD